MVIAGDPCARFPASRACVGPRVPRGDGVDRSLRERDGAAGGSAPADDELARALGRGDHDNRVAAERARAGGGTARGPAGRDARRGTHPGRARPGDGARRAHDVGAGAAREDALGSLVADGAGPGGTCRTVWLPVGATDAGPLPGTGTADAGTSPALLERELADELARLDEAAAIAARVGADTKTFLLIGRRRKLGHNGWLHGGARGDDPRTQASDHAAWLAPADATALGLTDGDSVELSTRAGKLALPAFAREGVLVGTVVVPHGLPDLNVNAIIPSGAEAVERISGQHRMTGIPVELRPGPRPAPP